MCLINYNKAHNCVNPSQIKKEHLLHAHSSVSTLDAPSELIIII